MMGRRYHNLSELNSDLDSLLSDEAPELLDQDDIEFLHRGQPRVYVAPPEPPAPKRKKKRKTK